MARISRREYSSCNSALTLSSGTIHSPKLIVSQSNLGLTQGCPVPAPTIERLETPDGYIWRVTYAGMTRYHRQDWQAWWLFELARAAYYAGGGSWS